MFIFQVNFTFVGMNIFHAGKEKKWSFIIWIRNELNSFLPLLICAFPSSMSRMKMYHDDATHGPSFLMSMKNPVLQESFIKWHHELYVMLFFPQTWSSFRPWKKQKTKKDWSFLIFESYKFYQWIFAFA